MKVSRTGKRRLPITSGIGIGLVCAIASAAPAHATLGSFDRTWGKDVVSDGLANTGFEVCTTASLCQPGSNTTALFGELAGPHWVTADGAGHVFVADSANYRVQEFDGAGRFERAWGKDVIQGGGDGFEVCVGGLHICKAGVPGSAGGEFFGAPGGIGVDPFGHVYVADPGNTRVQRFDTLGNFQLAWGRDVVATGSPSNDPLGGFEICLNMTDVCKGGDTSTGLGGEFSYPSAVAADATGVYVADRDNNRIQKFTAGGAFDRAWGKDVDGVDLDTDFEVCLDATNCKIGDPSNGVGDIPLGGTLWRPEGIAADGGGSVYVSESHHRIQKFTSAGVFDRTWGKDVIQGGATDFEVCTAMASCKDGLYDTAEGGVLYTPRGVAADGFGNVYVGDELNNRIQSFSSSGSFQRTWGKDVTQGGVAGFEICVAPLDTCKAGQSPPTSGLGGEMNGPWGVGATPGGAVFVADKSNHRIQLFADPALAPPPPPPGGGGAPPGVIAATGKRAAALRKCKKKNGGARRKCLKKARKLPV